MIKDILKTEDFNRESSLRRQGFRGFSLIEVIVASSIITVSIVGIVGVYGTFLKYNFTNTPGIQAAYLSDEGIEAVKSMRDFGWNANIAPLSEGSTYWLYFNTALNKWQATSTLVLVDNYFNRTFTLASAYRDGNADLASSGTIDPNTRLVTVTVAWNNRGSTSTKTLVTYISDLFDN